MPRFPVAFGKRKAAAPKDDGEVVSSFRVLERPDTVGVKSFDGTRGVARPIPTVRAYSQVDYLAEEENMFAGLKGNRGSGSSNTTKTASTDTSSRHSAVSTAPSSAAPPTDLSHQQHPEETNVHRKPYSDIPLPPPPKSSSFLNRAGRTFSFGSSKKNIPPVPAPEVPVTAHDPLPRARGMTASTTSTATPPKLDDEQVSIDLGDFGTMFQGFDKRASVATVRDEAPRGMPPRSLTGNRVSAGHLLPPQSNGAAPQSQQPHSPHSVESNHSNDGLLNDERSFQPPPHSPSYNQRATRPSNTVEDEDANLFAQSVAASKRLGASDSSAQGGRYTRTGDAGRKSGEDGNLFDNAFVKTTRAAQRYAARPPSPPQNPQNPQNRVMTSAQFEKFKQEKEQERTAAQSKNKAPEAKDEEDEEDEDYEDDEDEVEKSKQAAKQRRKQEAHMSVYRQQMMKVTGESLPRQYLSPAAPAARTGNTTDGSDEDEEIPLAILAAHGFPAKNRAPTRLSTVGSNPNLRASTMATPPPQPSRASTTPLGEHPAQGAGNRASQLPAFARRLPQDPFVGAGLVKNSARESMAMGGGAPAPPQGSVPPGGLVGVIASEERSRAMRRNNPHVAGGGRIHNANGTPGPGVDPTAGIPPQAMYGMDNPSAPHHGGMGFPQPPSLSPGDQAQIQMTQQMQQFMHMQMQFMQMMAGNQGAGGARPNSFMGGSPMGDMPSRQSYVGGEYNAEQRPMMDDHMRSMSMVQPSSESWAQPMPGYAPSIRVQGEGYTPSIAPSERSNIGLPGRYRPVSHVPTVDPMRRASTMTGALGSWDDPQKPRLVPSPTPPAKSGSHSDDDDEEGWAAMKEKREKKKSLWKSKKGFGKELSALIS